MKKKEVSRVFDCRGSRCHETGRANVVVGVCGFSNTDAVEKSHRNENNKEESDSKRGEAGAHQPTSTEGKNCPVDY